MKLLREFFHWLFYGSAGAAESSPRPDAEASSAATVKKVPAKKKEGIEFDLDKGANTAHFMEDLKSIEPLSKQFSGAREDLLRELKKLAPVKKTNGSNR